MSRFSEKEDFDISIIGRQTFDDESDLVEIDTSGSYLNKNGIRYITYKEYDEDNPSVHRTNIIKVEDSKVTLIRPHSTTRLILEPGKRHLCMYDTGFGPVTIGVFTDYIKSTLGDKGGKLDIRYTLDIDSNLSSINLLTAKVKPKIPDMTKDIEV